MKKWLFPLCAALLLGVTACTPGAVSKESPPPVSPLANTAPPTPVPTAAVSVHTDWSKLGEKPGPLPEIKSRRYEKYTDTLIPKDDYGMLIPYAGSRLLDDWPAANGCLWGLMTTEGVVVTDPVFSSAYRASYYSDYDSGNYGNIPLPLLVLTKGDPTLGVEAWDAARIAIAASDGSWVTDFEYLGVRAYDNGLLLCTADSLTLMEPDGRILNRYTPADLGLPEKEFKWLLSAVISYEGCGGNWVGDYVSLKWTDDTITAICLFQVSTGQQITMLYDEWNAYLTANQVLSQPGERESARAVVLERMLADLLPEQNGQGEWITDELLGNDAPGLLRVFCNVDERIETRYYSESGEYIPWLDNWYDTTGRTWYRRVNLKGGLIETLDLDMASYYDIDTMECVFRTYLGYDQGA